MRNLLPILLAVGLLAAPARSGLEVSPVVIEAVVVPDSPLAGRWTLGNPGPAATTVTATAILYDDYAHARSTAPSPAWLRLSETTVELPPRSETTIRYQLLLPSGSSGETLALVLFMERPRAAMASLTGRIGAAVYALVAGTARPALFVRQVRLAGDPVKGFSLVLELENRGNCHLRPRGSCRILDARGRCLDEVATLGNPSVLPGTRELVSTRTLARAPAGRSLRVQWRLTTGLVDGQPGPELTGDTTLILVPR